MSTLQSSLPKPTYRSGIKTHLATGSYPDVTVRAKDYTPGITAAPAGNTAVAAAFPYKGKIKNLSLA